MSEKIEISIPLNHIMASAIKKKNISHNAFLKRHVFCSRLDENYFFQVHYRKMIFFIQMHVFTKKCKPQIKILSHFSHYKIKKSTKTPQNDINHFTAKPPLIVLNLFY